MACKFEYNGKWHTEDELAKALESMPPHEAHKYIPGVQNLPNAPFKKNWDELALKRVIRHAAENGYDQISWTPGEAQAARYDLSKSVKNIDWKPEYGNTLVEINPNGGKQIGVYVNKEGTVTPNQGYDVHAKPYEGKPLADIVGKELAEKIMASEKGKLEGEGLRIGGEGMKGFYDKILVDRANALGKKFGAKVQMNENLNQHGQGYKLVKEGGKEKLISQTGFEIHDPESIRAFKAEYAHPVHVLPLTPGLRDTALQKGFPLFSSSHAGMTFTPIQHDPFKFTEVDDDPFAK